MFSWNYRMIKVAEEDGKDYGAIVEVTYNEEGEIDGFAAANIMSFEELAEVNEDLQKQEGKLLTFFWDNGTFGPNLEWTPHK